MKKLLVLILMIVTAGEMRAQWTATYYAGPTPSPHMDNGISDFYFINDSTGLVGNHYGDPSMMTFNQSMLTSSDYGLNWAVNDSALGAPLAGVTFTKFVGLQGDTVLRRHQNAFEWSADNGHTWTVSCTTGGPVAIAFDFVDSKNGLCYSYDGTSAYLNIFKNGVNISVPPPPGVNGFGGMQQIKMINVAKAFALTDSTQQVLMTTDSGYTWSVVLDTTATFTHIDFTSDMTGYVLGYNGTIYKTTDGGLSWNLLSTGSTEELLNCSFINDNTGLVSGSNGLVLRTNDGGLTWTDMSVSTLYGILQVQLLDNYAYCMDGSWLYRTNSALGIHEEKTEAPYFSVYPNPTNGHITISNPKLEKIISVGITNSLGQCEYSQTMNTNNDQVRIDLPVLSKGIKFLNIYGKTNSVHRILIE